MSEKKHKEGFREFILMALLKTEPLRYEELWDKFMHMASHIAIGSRYFEEWGENFRYRVDEFMSKLGLGSKKKRIKRRRIRKREPVEPEFRKDLEELLEKNLVHLNKEGKYGLTAEGRKQAQQHTKDMEKGAEIFRRQIMSPAGAARNTVIIDFFLAVMKLAAGFVSGSVALIADGADAAIDTTSAVVVWVGIRFKREHLGTLIITLMMFLTGLTVGYESATTLLDAVASTIKPISNSLLVIGVELVALTAAVILSIYQRYVGKMNGGLALISQSIDSKNHIYVAGAVIIGAVFSLLGIHSVDALIGAYIAVHILKDSFGLFREALSSMKGEETDFTKYGMPLAKHYEGYRLKSFRGWIMYCLREDGLRTKKELISSRKRCSNLGMCQS